DTDERALEIGELRGDVARQVDPADDAEDERRVEREQLARLVERVARLDDDRAVDAVAAQQRLEVLRAVAAAEVVRQPRIVSGLGIPEVLVRVDDHASSAHSASGTSTPASRTSSSTSAGVRQPTSVVATAACRPGNCTATASSGTPWRAHSSRSPRTRARTSGGAMR